MFENCHPKHISIFQAFPDDAIICHAVNSSSGTTMGYSNIHKEKLNYANAKAACEEKNMELAMPRTQEQYDKLVQLESVDG